MHRARCLHPDARTGWQLRRQALDWLWLVGNAKVPGRLKNANVDPVHADVATHLDFHGGLLGVNLAVSWGGTSNPLPCSNRRSARAAARFLSTGPEGGGKISRTGSVLPRVRWTVLSLHPSYRNITAAPPGARNIQGLFESRSEARFVRLARSSSAAALPRQAAQGHPANAGRDSRGGLLWVTFLGRARKVTSRRAAPGLLKILREFSGTQQSVQG